jgi:hypothetical protein
MRICRDSAGAPTGRRMVPHAPCVGCSAAPGVANYTSPTRVGNFPLSPSRLPGAIVLSPSSQPEGAHAAIRKIRMTSVLGEIRMPQAVLATDESTRGNWIPVMHVPPLSRLHHIHNALVCPVDDHSVASYSDRSTQLFIASGVFERKGNSKHFW